MKATMPGGGPTWSLGTGGRSTGLANPTPHPALRPGLSPVPLGQLRPQLPVGSEGVRSGDGRVLRKPRGSAAFGLLPVSPDGAGVSSDGGGSGHGDADGHGSGSGGSSEGNSSESRGEGSSSPGRAGGGSLPHRRAHGTRLRGSAWQGRRACPLTLPPPPTSPRAGPSPESPTTSPAPSLSSCLRGTCWHRPSARCGAGTSQARRQASAWT